MCLHCKISKYSSVLTVPRISFSHKLRYIVLLLLLEFTHSWETSVTNYLQRKKTCSSKMTLKVQNTLPHLENSERTEALLGLAPGWPSGFHVTACSHFSVCTAVRRFDVVFTPSTFIDVVYVPESAAKAPCGALSSWFRPCPGARTRLPSGAAASTRSTGKAMSSTRNCTIWHVTWPYSVPDTKNHPTSWYFCLESWFKNHTLFIVHPTLFIIHQCLCD